MRPFPPVTHTPPNLIQNQQAAQRPAIPATPTHHEPHASGVPAPKLSREQLAVLRHTFNSSPLRRLRAEPPGPGGGSGLAGFKAAFAAEAKDWADCLRPQELQAMAWHTAIQIVPAHEASALANELVRSVSSPGMPFEKLMDGSFVPGHIGLVESAVSTIIDDVLHWKDQDALPPFLTAQARRLDTLLAGYPWPHATPAQAAKTVHVFHEHLLAQALDLGDDGPQAVRDSIEGLVRTTFDELGFKDTATVGNPDAAMLQQAGYVPQKAPGTAPPLALSRFTTADFLLQAPMFDGARQLVEGLASYNAVGFHHFMADVRAKGDPDLTAEIATAALMGIILNPKLSPLEQSQALQVIGRDLPAGLPASMNDPGLLDKCEAALHAHSQPALSAAFRRCVGSGDVFVVPKGPPPGAKRTAESAGLTLSADPRQSAPLIAPLAVSRLAAGYFTGFTEAMRKSTAELVRGLASFSPGDLQMFLDFVRLEGDPALSQEIAAAALMGMVMGKDLSSSQQAEVLNAVRDDLPAQLPQSLSDPALIAECEARLAAGDQTALATLFHDIVGGHPAPGQPVLPQASPIPLPQVPPVPLPQVPSGALPQVGPVRTSNLPDPARLAPPPLALDLLRRHPIQLLQPPWLSSRATLMDGLADATRSELTEILAHVQHISPAVAQEVAVATLMGVALTPNLHAWTRPDMLAVVSGNLPATLPASLQDRELLLRCIDHARANGYHEVSQELSKYL